VTGSIKFDGAATDRDNSGTRSMRKLLDAPADARIFLAGSTQEPEEAIALDAFARLAPAHPELRLILVPRHPERFDAVARKVQQSGHRWCRRSQIDGQRAPRGCRVLLVDTVGELSAWWGVADVGFVGGSLGSRGGQNMIEPAAYGVPICFGPNTRNFRDVVSLLVDDGAARVVHDTDELTAFVGEMLNDPKQAAAMGSRAQVLVQQQAGALERTLDLLAPLLARLRIGESASSSGRTAA
jgi:3-deoxy-D-manno-octulosonic-acid transferase